MQAPRHACQGICRRWRVRAAASTLSVYGARRTRLSHGRSALCAVPAKSTSRREGTVNVYARPAERRIDGTSLGWMPSIAGRSEGGSPARAAGPPCGHTAAGPPLRGAARNAAAGLPAGHAAAGRARAALRCGHAARGACLLAAERRCGLIAAYPKRAPCVAAAHILGLNPSPSASGAWQLRLDAWERPACR
jgi:hypothetical protein